MLVLLMTVLLVSLLTVFVVKLRFFLICLRIPSLSIGSIVAMAKKLKAPEDIVKVSLEAFNSHGDTFFSWFISFPIIVTRDPDFASEVLTSPSCNEKNFVYRSIIKYFCDGILTCPLKDWQKHRKLLSLAVQLRAQMDYVPIINKNADELCGRLSESVGIGETELHLLLKRTIFKNSSEMFFAKDIPDVNTIPVEDFERGMIDLTEIVMKPYLLLDIFIRRWPKWQHFQKYVQSMKDYTAYLFSKENRSDRPCGMLKTAEEMVAQNQIDYDLLQGSLRQFLIGSYDTTGETLINALYLLAVNPNVQERLHDEIVSVIHGDDIRYEDLNMLYFMEMIIHETLRLFPPVPFVGRLATEDFKLKTIAMNCPKNVHFVISLFDLHRNKRFWGPDANKFNPENFCPENVATRNSNAYLPFVKGSKNCPGYKNGIIVLKIMLCKILRNYRFSSTFKYEDLEVVVGISLHLKKYPKLSVERRKKIV